MNAKVGKGVIAASLACVALSSALCLTTGKHSALAEDAIIVQEDSLVACERALSTIGSEVEALVSGYNSVYESDWAASEIEYSSPVFLVEDDKYGMYLDFDDNNGYAVITTDKKIYGLETSGDLDYLRNGSEIYYSYIDGFLFLDDNGQYHKYELDEEVSEYKEELNEYKITSFSNAVSSTNSVSGDAVELKTIYLSQLDSYVTQKYQGFTLFDKYNIAVDGFPYGYDRLTSYYRREYNNSKDYRYDNNSLLNAMYNVMWDWNRCGYINVPDECHDIRKSIFDDIFYSDYSRGTKTGVDDKGSYKWITNTESQLQYMPVLYSNIRSYAVKNGYTPEVGYDHDKVPETMKYVANFLYGNKLDVYRSDVATVVSSLKSNRSCVLNVSNGKDLDRGVAVLGVYRYRKETDIGSGYSQYKYKYFYKITYKDIKGYMAIDPDVIENAKLDFYCTTLPRC